VDTESPVNAIVERGMLPDRCVSLPVSSCQGNSVMSSCRAGFGAKSRCGTRSSIASLMSLGSMTVGSHGEVHLGRYLLNGSSMAAAAGSDQEDLQGTAWTAYVSLVLTCLGSSILTVPWIMAQSGCVLGCSAIALPALLSTGTVRWLFYLADTSSSYSYQGIMNTYVGRIGDILTFLTLNVTIFLVSSSCCTIVSEVVPTLHADLSQRIVILIIFGICVAPAAAKTLVLLHKFVAFGFIACIALVGLIVGRAVAGGTVDSTATLVRMTDSFPWSVALSNACFGVEMSVLTVAAEMGPARRHRVIRSADLALLTCMALYCIAGLAAYAQYGVSVKPNILVSFGEDLWSKVAKILLVVVNLARVPVFTILQRDLSSTKSACVQRMHRESDRWFSRGVFGMTHVLASSLAGYLFASAGRALGVAGGTVGVAINIGLPAAAWVRGRCRGEVATDWTLDARLPLDALAVLSLLAIPAFLVLFSVSFTENFGKI